MGILHKIQADLQGKHITPENFSDRIIFMSMFNDIILGKKDNEDSCALTLKKIKQYASKFNDGHWAFLGPGEESKCVQGKTTNCGGKWDLRASEMVEDFENSGHPVFQGMSPLGGGVLKKKNNRDTIHFNGSIATLTCCTGLFIPRISSVFTEQSQSGLEIYLEQILERQVRADMKVLARHTEKFKSSSRISSNWLIFRDYRNFR